MIDMRDEELTTQQAADLLNVSRSYLTGLLDKGEVAHAGTGDDRRIKARDVYTYKAERDANRARALDQLIADDADFL
ncbi:helix-turn-helix domain-containing protein [Sphingomonas sp.]|uniref:helix-turn-helix domain-containing protein n=1 Tax=Sphingomonas sp. TaxID=28214 RepID=UPI0035C83B49